MARSFEARMAQVPRPVPDEFRPAMTADGARVLASVGKFSLGIATTGDATADAARTAYLRRSLWTCMELDRLGQLPPMGRAS